VDVGLGLCRSVTKRASSQRRWLFCPTSVSQRRYLKASEGSAEPAFGLVPRLLAYMSTTIGALGSAGDDPAITVIIGGRALLMLIAARFSGPGSGKDLLSRAISLIASGLLPSFSSFPIPVAPEARGSRAMGSSGRPG
jgi:hypothetical protein